MRRSGDRGRRSGCPVGLALDVVGDPWTLLVVRDMMFRGARTFNDFLGAGEGIATNVLSDRLARLEANGLVTRERDREDARRFIYRLTEKGIDLAPVLLELIVWSASHTVTDAPPEVVERMRNDRAGFLAETRSAWRASRPGADGEG